MKKNYLILSFCLIPILASKCIDFEGDSWVTLKNNADYGVVALLQTFLQDFVIRILCCRKHRYSILL